MVGKEGGLFSNKKAKAKAKAKAKEREKETLAPNIVIIHTSPDALIIYSCIPVPSLNTIIHVNPVFDHSLPIGLALKLSVCGYFS